MSDTPLEERLRTLAKALRLRATLIPSDARCCDEAADELARLQAENAELRADKGRIDWLADSQNTIGNVQLPATCVQNNLHSLRAAIDEAMRLDPRKGE